MSLDYISHQHIILPMAALALFTFLVFLMLMRSRLRALDEGKVSVAFYKTYVGADEPEESRKLSRHLSNLLEVPVLFYVVCLAALSVQLSSLFFQTAAWVYVLVRLVHAYIHLGSNKVPYRLAAYFTGWLILILMWITLVYEVLK